MKIAEAIVRLDSLKQNTFHFEEKVAWLSRLDHTIKKDIIDTHDGADAVTFQGYTPETDPDTELLAPAPFDEMYLHWMEAQIDYYNDELDRYNKSMQTFQTEYNDYARWYNRNHMPLGGKMKYF